MTVNRKVTGTAATIPAGLAAGVLSSVGTMLAGTLLCALLIEKEILIWKKSGYAIMVILIISSWIGATTASKKIKRRRLMVCGASGIVYFLVLLIMGGLFFGGKYSGVGESALLIFCGTILGFLNKEHSKSKRKGRKIKMSNG